jgi:hypothetical protein
MATRKNTEAAQTPADAQPAGSGAVPGSAQGAEEVYTGPGAYAGGEQVAPGINDGTKQDVAELKDQPGDNELEFSEPMVYYIGEFGRREITVEDWRAANVQDMPMVVWDRNNKKAVPQKDFTDQALTVLRQDPSFRFA